MTTSEHVLKLSYLLNFMKKGESLNNREIAKRIGISELTVANLLNQSSKRPRTTTINKIRKYFKTTPDLFGLPYSEFKDKMKEKWGVRKTNRANDKTPSNRQLNGTWDNIVKILQSHNTSLEDFYEMFELDPQKITREQLTDEKFIQNFIGMFGIDPRKPYVKKPSPIQQPDSKNILQQQIDQIAEIIKNDRIRITETSMTTNSKGEMTLCIKLKQ